MKKTAISLLLIAGLIVGGVGVWKSLNRGGMTPPDHVMNSPQTRIDTNTLDTVTLSRSEWSKLGEKDGLCKNPKTGDYTMALVVRCASCGKEIPKPAAMPDPEHQTYERLKKAYEESTCPRCGKPALEPPPPPVVPQPSRPPLDAQ